MDKREAILDVLKLCNQHPADFNNAHGDTFLLAIGPRRMTTLYPLGSNMQELAPTQIHFYRAMPAEQACELLNWLYLNNSVAFPLDITDPLCLASCMDYCIRSGSLKKGYVLVEFFAPTFASTVFDADRSKNKIFGLKGENGDFSWGLSIRTQMSYNGSNPDCQQLIKALPIYFKNAINRGGGFKVVAYRSIE